MVYGNYCYIIIENFPKKFSPCKLEIRYFRKGRYAHLSYRDVPYFTDSPLTQHFRRNARGTGRDAAGRNADSIT